MFDVNVRGRLNCVQAVASHMTGRRYGKIVNVSSGSGFGTSVVGTTPCAVTKAAVAALTKRLVLEIGPHGINVNAVCPGFIRTDMVMRSVPAQEVAPLMVTAVSFLAPDEASFITGILTVDGGRTDYLSHSA